MIEEKRDLQFTIDLVRAKKLDADPLFLTYEFEELLFICNGCGAANSKFDFVPDTMWGMSIKPACNIHDFDYHIGKTIEDKQRADRRFLNNLLRLINRGKSKILKLLRRRRALKYYDAVDLMGGPAFWQ